MHHPTAAASSAPTRLSGLQKRGIAPSLPPPLPPPPRSRLPSGTHLLLRSRTAQLQQSQQQAAPSASHCYAEKPTSSSLTALLMEPMEGRGGTDEGEGSSDAERDAGIRVGRGDSGAGSSIASLLLEPMEGRGGTGAGGSEAANTLR